MFDIEKYMKEENLTIKDIAKRLKKSEATTYKIISRNRGKEVPVQLYADITNSQIYMIDKENKEFINVLDRMELLSNNDFYKLLSIISKELDKMSNK